MPRLPADPDQFKRLMVFLRNHNDVIVAMDLFTILTASLRISLAWHPVPATVI
jgi:hypothetical protein